MLSWIKKLFEPTPNGLLLKKTHKMLSALSFKNEEVVKIEGKGEFKFYEKAPFFGRTMPFPTVFVTNCKGSLLIYKSLATEKDPSSFITSYELFFNNYDDIKRILEKRREEEYNRIKSLTKS